MLFKRLSAAPLQYTPEDAGPPGRPGTHTTFLGMTAETLLHSTLGRCSGDFLHCQESRIIFPKSLLGSGRF